MRRRRSWTNAVDVVAVVAVKDLFQRRRRRRQRSRVLIGGKRRKRRNGDRGGRGRGNVCGI